MLLLSTDSWKIIKMLNIHMHYLDAVFMATVTAKMSYVRVF